MDFNFECLIAHIREVGADISHNLFLESVAVHPREHGRGIGRRLLEFAEERAGQLGLKVIFSQVYQYD
ncbi:MAG: GNAT family N-acetyltransferase, partial [Victivallaceae bacterium]